jgi:hypothetical protein
MQVTSCVSDLKIPIIKGEDAEIDVFLKYKDTGKPVNLTGATVKAYLEKEDGTWLEIAGGDITMISEVGGNFKITISNTNSALLKDGSEMSFEVEYNIGGVIRIVQFLKKLNISDSLRA